MDKLLKPNNLDISPNDSEAPATFKYWLATFEKFLEEVEKKVEEVDKQALLINFLSPTVYPYVEDHNTYDCALGALKAAYIKRKNDIFARHILATRKQQNGENLEQFLQALKILSKDCTFRAVSAEQYREELLRDAFINGLSSSTIRQRLLERDDLTLQNAFEQACTLYRAHEHSNSYGGVLSVTASSSSELPRKEVLEDKTTSTGQTLYAASHSKTRKCFYCGAPYHNRSRCPARNADCNRCGKKGHFAKVCLSKQTPPSNAAASLTDSLIASTVGAPACLDCAVVDVVIQDEAARALIDSGASDSYLNEGLAGKINLPKLGTQAKIALASSTNIAAVSGYVEAKVQAFDQSYHLRLGIVKNLCADIILGQDFLKLHKSATFETGGQRDSILICPEKVCCVAAANIDPPRLFRFLRKDIHPIATPSRRYSEDDANFIKAEVQKLLSEEIIEPSTSPWRAQVLVTKNDNHKRRMVIDYSQTINRFTELDAYPLPRIDEQINQLAKSRIFSTLDLKSAYYQIPLHPDDRVFTAFEAAGQLYQYRRLPFGVTNGVAAFQRIIDKIIASNKLKHTYAYIDNITIGGADQDAHDENLRLFLKAAKEVNLTFNESKSVVSMSQIKILGYEVSHGLIRPDPERLRPLVELPLPTNNKELKRCLGMFAYYARWIKDYSAKIKPLTEARVSFPLTPKAESSFESLRGELLQASLGCIDAHEPFTVECDASDFAIAAVLNQNGRPVAFMSRTLTACESRYPIIEKEAASIIEAVRKWSHYLYGRPFTLITDQRSLAFMFD